MTKLTRTVRFSRGIMACAALIAVFATACHAEPEAAATQRGPFIRVLGTAQDGGLPHVACDCERCEAARTIPGRRRLISSLAIVTPENKEKEVARGVYLVDATPDIRQQLDMLRDVRAVPEGGAGRVDRLPLQGIMLTHAHIGHYLGLAFLGFEAAHVRGVPTYCTPRMAEFLRTNGPWSQLVKIENLKLVESEPGKTFAISPEVSVTPIQVPHRDEYSDTVGFLIAGPNRRVFFVPDTEPWETWKVSLTATIDAHKIDTLLVDATFFSLEELPGRHVRAIGHPLMQDTMDLLQDRVQAGTLEVWFTHLNHSNPALDPASDARKEVDRRGFHVVDDGNEFAL